MSGYAQLQAIQAAQANRTAQPPVTVSATPGPQPQVEVPAQAPQLAYDPAQVNQDLIHREGMTPHDVDLIAKFFHPYLRPAASLILKYWDGTETLEEAKENGVALAINFLGGAPENEASYNQLVSLDKPMLMTGIRSFKPIWDVLGKQPDLAEAFVMSFLDKEAVEKEMSDEEPTVQ
jgi:hypothetical protein